jgi:serine/threonine protein kinase
MLTAGTIVAGYRVKDLLGEGGMAAVYEAHQVSLNRVVALKILSRRMGEDDAFRERFRRECEIQARLDHPNIVPVYEAGESDYGLWLAMRLVRGPTLRELLAGGALSPSRTLELLTPIAGALDVAHEHGLIHRDITPQNILVDERGHPYLADFGITKSRGDRSLTRPGQFVGTLDYVAPEQIQDEPTAAPADIYSLAAIFFECLTGRVPYAKQTEAAVLYAHIAERPPRATELDPSLPAAVDAVFRQGLAKAPGDRFARATELVDATREALHQTAEDRSERIPSSPSSDQREPGTSRAGKTRAGAGPPAAATTASDNPQPPPVPLANAGAAPATSATVSRRLPRSPAVVLPAVFFLAAAALGIGAATGDDSKPAERRPVAAGSLEVEPPADWSVRRGAAIAGFHLADPVTLAPSQQTGSEALVVGVSPATGEALLPARLARAAKGSAAGEPVSLGSLEALRYTGLQAPGLREPLTVFTSPTSLGAATLVCRPPAVGGREFLQQCQQIATSLKLSEGEDFPLGPSPELAAALKAQVSALARRRATLRQQLGKATGARRQASAADALARAFRRAARALSSLRVTPQSASGLAAVVDALRSARDAYKELATAARREDAAAYRAASAAVGRAESSVDDALRAMRELGYPIGGDPLHSGDGGAAGQGGAGSDDGRRARGS